MANIIELEVKNLSTEDKEKFYRLLKSNPDWENFSNSTLDKTLLEYFRKYSNDFITFQYSNKNRIYNQALKKHNFKDLTYEDAIENLTSKQKDKIISDIRSFCVVQFLTRVKF
ncbi:hypothetical protein [Mesomycoplasma ovipneumoniae]|uniref:hypothetical protein n=1 Tax=Mesomycoplasma ovipneumoniae TaxID=29562 RepID=UPI003B50FF66